MNFFEKIAVKILRGMINVKQSVGRRSYEGAERGRRTKHWLNNNSSADSELGKSLTTLRSRSRDLVRNSTWAKSGIDVLTDEIIGTGIIGVIKGRNKTQTKRLNALWKKWSESRSIDFDGRQNLVGLQKLVTRSIMEAGEIFVRVRRKRFDRNSDEFPLEFQLIEADHLEMTDTKNLKNGGAIIHGIEFNEKGKRIKYHVLKEHPGKNILLTNRKKEQISTDDMTHIYRIDRPGQNRGIPVLAPAMIKIRDLDEFEDAQIVRQKIAACYSVFVIRPEIPDLAGITTEEREELGEKVEPGLINILAPGEDIKFADPPGVRDYKEFVAVNLHSISKSMGISYESLTGDLSDVNFSSAKMGKLHMDRNTKSWQRNVIIPLFLDFVAQQFLDTAFLIGEDVNGARFNWTPPKVEMIDPTKEIPAKVKEIRAGLISLPTAIKERGGDPEETLREIEESNKLLDEKGIILDTDPRNVNQTGSVQAGEIKPEEENEPEEEK